MLSSSKIVTNLYFSTSIIRNYVRRAARNPNPGINRQVKLQDGNPENLIEDPEDFDDMESDLMNVHKSHKQYEKEMREHREKIQRIMVKNKYFKEKQPNFLTFAEKEQIKLLNVRDSNEWTPEKLSESFPADYETICKILKAKWVPYSAKRIKIHDQKVLENWNLLKNGDFPKLHPHLKEHLLNFTQRSPEDLKNLQVKFDEKFKQLPLPRSTEFLSIITSCRGLEKNKNLLESKAEISEQIDVAQNLNPGEEETFLKGKLLDKRPMRFQDLKFLKSSDDPTSENNQTENSAFIAEQKLQDVNVKKFETNEVVISDSDMKKFDVSPIKEKIYIPKRLWKRNATYKVKDCYYDYDGEFLYRVPGMNN